MGERIEESTQDKGHRQLIELLTELRVALPGVQVLFGFLLIVPFSARWERVTTFQSATCSRKKATKPPRTS